MATEFDYLMNRLEYAGQQEVPADHHYGTHRASVLRHVRALEKDAGRYRKLQGAFFLRVFRTDREGYPGCTLVSDELDAALDVMQG